MHLGGVGYLAFTLADGVWEHDDEIIIGRREELYGVYGASPVSELLASHF
jgi:hypothetical protein